MVGGGGVGGGGCSGRFSTSLLPSVVAFALGAAGAVDGGGVVVVADVAQGNVLRCRRAVRQAEEVHGGVETSPSPRPPVVRPAGADGAEVFLT